MPSTAAAHVAMRDEPDHLWVDRRRFDDRLLDDLVPRRWKLRAAIRAAPKRHLDKAVNLRLRRADTILPLMPALAARALRRWRALVPRSSEGRSTPQCTPFKFLKTPLKLGNPLGLPQHHVYKDGLVELP